MLNWASPIAAGHPLRRKFPVAYPKQVLPEPAVPGITDAQVNQAIDDYMSNCGISGHTRTVIATSRPARCAAACASSRE